MGTLQGKTALITGGTTGIGLATAERFVREGAKVYVLGRRRERVAAACAALGVCGLVGDVTSGADLDQAMARIREERGSLDILFANAAALELVSLAAIDEAHVDRLFDANVKSVIFTVQKALPLMPNGGAIVLTGSLGSIRGFPAQSVYAASKAAVRSLARTWTAELKERDIRVNVVSPGITATEGADLLFGGPEAAAAHRARVAPFVPAGRAASAAEIASAVMFLVSPDASYVRGVELFADGGFGQI